MNARSKTLDVYLKPGELWFGGGDVQIRTVLGSCVAITLWHLRHRIGGMCHFMLPQRASRDPQTPADGRYGDEAMGLLVEQIRLHRCMPSEFEAKLFGGGRMFAEHIGPDGSRRSLQAANVEAARNLVERYGLRLRAEHLGGAGHREVMFDLPTGAVWIRHSPLRVGDNAALEAAE